MTTHTITLARHTAQVVGLVGLVGVLVLGTWDSYGTEQLLLRPGPEWEGLAIDATFHNVSGDEGVTVLADTDGLVTVPPEACMRASKCATITFRGVQDGVQRISCNLPYVVLDHAQVPGANSTATPSENAQALAQMQDLRDGAVDAKNQAEAARDDAAKSAVASKESETNASQSATAAKTAQKAAASSASSASTSASTATTQAAAAKSSATTAKASEEAAGKSAKEAAASAANLDSAVNTATQKAAAASASAEAAKASESAAASSEAAARKYANSAELAAKTAGEAAAEKLQQMQAIQDDVTAKQAQTATDATAAEKAKVAAEAAQNGAAASETAAADSAAAAKTSEDAAAKSAADADSTANSINNSMMQIAANKEDTAALQKRQNVLVGSETGNPASCDDAFAAPLCGLNVYGKSTQDGTPTPDAPVPIVSAGDDGSVVVKVTGKNRMPSNLKYRDFAECFVKKNTFITLVFKDGFISNGGNILFIGENNENLWFGIDTGKAEHHITLKANATKFRYLLNNTASENVCLTWNASSPDYEPYHEQLLTLSTPNGLPGIPVTSGGNYTDQNGQQWVCDEVDLERGVRVQRVYKVDVDGENTKFEQTGDYANILPRGLPNALYAAGQRTYAISTFTNLSWFFNTKNGQFLYLIAADISGQINESCKKQLGKIYYALATPIETPLTPAEIAAYKALIAYAPDTVVQASDGAGVKLEYQRDVNIAIKKLEDAIASMTAT